MIRINDNYKIKDTRHTMVLNVMREVAQEGYDDINEYISNVMEIIAYKCDERDIATYADYIDALIADGAVILTVEQRIDDIVAHWDCNDETNLVAIAYHLGRERATKEISDKYTDMLSQINTAIDSNRYRKMIHDVVGKLDYIYSADYAGDISKTFGADIA